MLLGLVKVPMLTVTRESWCGEVKQMKTEFLDFAEEKTNYFSIYLGKKPSQQWILFNSVLRKFTYALKLGSWMC